MRNLCKGIISYQFTNPNYGLNEYLLLHLHFMQRRNFSFILKYCNLCLCLIRAGLKIREYKFIVIYFMIYGSKCSIATWSYLLLITSFVFVIWESSAKGFSILCGVLLDNSFRLFGQVMFIGASRLSNDKSSKWALL